MEKMNVSLVDHPIVIKDFDALDQGDGTTELEDSEVNLILPYLRARLDGSLTKRLSRIQRMAAIDQMVSTWQKLSPEDTQRLVREDATGRLQALPINMPLIQAHLDDAVAFFAEVFAPVGGQFFAMPGKKDQNGIIKNLADKMEEDMKQSSYYAAVTSSMRTLTKYNVGGFLVEWAKKSRLNESDGNMLKSLDMYNFIYDNSVKNPDRLHCDGEWAATIEVVNKLWLIRHAEREGFQNLEKVFKGETADGHKMNSFIAGKANYYKHPPSQTKMDSDGADGKTGTGEAQVDWESYGLGLTSDTQVDIDGHELITIWAFINPEQFGLDRSREDGSIMELWKFRIVDSNWIISAEAMPEAIELPTYLTRMNQDEMGEAARSLAEHLRPFQRFISFLLNTHVEGIRKNVWGTKVYDPAAIDVSNIKSGETSGLLPLKKPGDVRAAFQAMDSSSDTVQNIQTAGEFMNLMKQLFPNQAMPSQIAGMDRAVSSQVSAVLQGSMRKMHMIVRSMDSSLMLPTRMAMYRNIAAFDESKSELQGITPGEVAKLLGSGLGQINREAAAEQVRTLLFALIQNPDSAGTHDLPGLYQLWSMLMNIGTDLSEFVTNPQAAAAAAGIDPNAPVSAVPNSTAAGIPGGML